MSDAVEGELVNESHGVRLTKFSEKIVQKLEQAFHWGFNITEACQHADISRVTYYEWLGQDDVFSYRMSVAQAKVNKDAKALIVEAMQRGDANLALRYLTLRDKDFRPKAEVTNTPELLETREKIKDFLDDVSKHDPSSEPPPTDSTVAGAEVPQPPTDIS